MDPEKSAQLHPHLILPVGTQVVTLVDVRSINGQPERLKGMVGKITRAPADGNHAYQVTFPDGGQIAMHRDQLAIRKQVQGPNFDLPPGVLSDRNLYQHVIYRCAIGSRAYGLDVEGSDTDMRGIYLPPAAMHWSLYGVPEQIEDIERQECFWEIQKFLVLALKANPHVLECLYTPLVEHADHIAEELLAERSRFLSKLVFQTYNGYVMGQFKKLEQDMRTSGQLKVKHMMHLIRLLLSAVTILREQYVPVKVSQYRERLMAIRQGESTWEEVNDWRLQLHTELDTAYARTTLPDRPDYVWVNDFLVRARASAV